MTRTTTTLHCDRCDKDMGQDLDDLDEDREPAFSVEVGGVVTVLYRDMCRKCTPAVDNLVGRIRKDPKPAGDK